MPPLPLPGFCSGAAPAPGAQPLAGGGTRRRRDPMGGGDLAPGWRTLSLPSIPLTGQFSPVFYRTFQSRKCDRAADRCPYLVFVREAPLGASSAELPLCRVYGLAGGHSSLGASALGHLQ